MHERGLKNKFREFSLMHSVKIFENLKIYLLTYVNTTNSFCLCLRGFKIYRLAKPDIGVS